jgi:hypothetical protein
MNEEEEALYRVRMINERNAREASRKDAKDARNKFLIIAGIAVFVTIIAFTV